MRIILPGRSYGEAQKMLQCLSLDIRRGKLCEKTMKKIALDGRLSRHLTTTRENKHGYNFQWRRQNDNWGGGGGANIHISLLTDCKNNRFQKKLITQNTNILIFAPPIIDLPAPLIILFEGMLNNSLLLNVKLIGLVTAFSLA